MNRAIERWRYHVKVLAHDIGPRGPTTQGEDRGLKYCAQVLADLGLKVREDRFGSAGSVFRPHLVAAAGILLAFATYPALPWLAAGLGWLVVISEVLELTLRPNPLQWVLPRRPSRNVYATIEPEGGAQRDLIVMGHVDSQRTPKIFSTIRWLQAYRAFSSVAFASFCALAVAYSLGAVYNWPWVWPASSVAAVCAVGLALICIEAELSPFTAGANDNATAAGLILTLAEELQASPPTAARLWLVCTGCEEALHEGARAFFRRHRAEMTAPRALVLEMLGCSGPAWLDSEGIVLRVPSDPALRALAADVAVAHPELGAYPVKLAGGVTEMADALAAGIPAITIIGLTPDGLGPYWHLPTDTLDKLDPAAMERNYGFVRKMVAALGDGRRAGQPGVDPPGGRQ